MRGFWETAVANFRHATGLSTDLVVDHINHVSCLIEKPLNVQCY